MLSRAVRCINNGKTFGSLRAAGTYAGIISTAINAHLVGKTKYAGKDKDGKPLVWEYADGNPLPWKYKARKTKVSRPFKEKLVRSPEGDYHIQNENSRELVTNLLEELQADIFEIKAKLVNRDLLQQSIEKIESELPNLKSELVARIGMLESRLLALEHVSRALTNIIQQYAQNYPTT